MAVALAAANARWTLDDLRAALLDEANAAGDWLRIRQRSRGGTRTFRNDGDIERRLDRLWCKAQARIGARPPASDRYTVRAELAEIRHAVDARPRLWGGQGGVTDRAVLAALLDIADAGLTLTPSCSARQLAERANVTHQTAAASLRRLISAGLFLRMETPHVGTMATAYRLLRPPAARDDVDGGGGVEPNWSSDRAHDAFAFHGLGRIGARVFDLLPDERAIAESDLARMSGLHRRTVRRYLVRLHDVGLADRRPGGWERGRAELDTVAQALGTAGCGQRRQHQHARERAAFVEYVVDFQSRHGWAVERGLYRPHDRRLPFPSRGPTAARRSKAPAA